MSTTAPGRDSAPPQRSRETRIGLVMYGGVSLAVYINGVAQEFYHAVQGNGVYRLIKELTDSEINLDILSGSSAGGINGILLAYSLCNGKDFTRSADLWRNAADIRRLVRPPSNTDEAVRSVLDSEGYYQTELENAFRKLDSLPAIAEAPSPLKELDLFITGTDIDGRTYKRVDDAGHVIEAKDYRCVFQLKYRHGRKSNFDSAGNPAVITALSKLARITSCFPGAFAPVFVSHSESKGKDSARMSANELLQYWGALPRAAYMIDGGVIDNKPFTHTIREIFFRTTERKVDRKLYYVEPDPERFPEHDGDYIPDVPNFLKPIVNSLVTIPGYESITDDLKLLSERNEKIREYKRVLKDVSASCESLNGVSLGVESPPNLGEPQKSIYERVRYASISDRALQGVFKKATFENSPKLAAQRTQLVDEFDGRISGTTGILRDFDILFRLRRVFHLIYYLYDLLYGASRQRAPKERRQQYVELLKRLNAQLELFNVLNSAMETLVDQADYGWDEQRQIDPSEVWNRVSASLQQLLRADGLTPHLENLNELNRVLRLRTEQSKTLFIGVPNFRSILIEADNLLTERLEQSIDKDDPVFQQYLHFNEIDGHVFPIEWVSGLREKDVIEVFRVSPVDARRGFSDRDAGSKTAGDSLGHFSAFFKRTWRANDIMWGRLDAVCELTETLLTKQTIFDAMGDADARLRARNALLPEDGSPSPLDQWFKHSSEAAIRRIKSWIHDITDSDPAIAEPAIASFYSDNRAEQSIRDLLIEMAQFRILHECLPQVFEDSIKEQSEWKQLRQQRGTEPEKLAWLGRDVCVDRTALNAMAIVGGQRLLEELESGRPVEEYPRQSRLGQVFDKFQIGAEEVWGGGVPFLILAEIGTKTMLVLRNCILGSFNEKTAGKIRASTFYRWGVDLPLRTLYGSLVFFRSTPGVQPSILVGLTLLSLLALFVGLNWRQAIIQPGGQLHMFWFAVFIIAPLAWLSAGAYQLSRTHIGRTRFDDTVRNALVAICTAAPLISVTMVYFGLTDLVWDWWTGTAEPVGSRNLQLLMILLYGIVPFVLSFIGGYLAVRSRRRRLDVEDLTGALERMTESELQDVSDRVGEQHKVTPESRLKIVKALTVAAEMNNALGTLERAIRAVKPDALD
jgi:predicted acylesterase/phospholipase RssA